MIERAYYKGLIKVAQGLPDSSVLPQQWFTDRGYTQAQYNEYKDVGSTLDPVDRQQHIRDMIDMDRKAAQVPKTTTTRRQGNTVTTTTTGSGTFRQGKLVPPGGTQPVAPVPAQPPQSIQPQKQPTTVTQQAPVRQPAYTRNKQIRKAAPVQARPAQPKVQPQAPASSTNTPVRHKGYKWQAFSDATAARKHYGGNVIGTKINGQTYYRPFDVASSNRTGSYASSTRNASRPRRRVVVPAYRRII